MPQRKSSASAVAPAARPRLFPGIAGFVKAELVAATVLTVTTPVSPMAIEVAGAVQVGESPVWFEGPEVNAQLSVTVPA